MQTSQLDQIIRQKDPKLLTAVQHLANNETAEGMAMLAEAGRVTGIASAQDRPTPIARNWAARPKGTIIVSPDNRSRQEICVAVRAELLANDKLAADSQVFGTLAHRSDMVSSDRTWACATTRAMCAQYTPAARPKALRAAASQKPRFVDTRANTPLSNATARNLFRLAPAVVNLQHAKGKAKARG